MDQSVNSVPIWRSKVKQYWTRSVVEWVMSLDSSTRCGCNNVRVSLICAIVKCWTLWIGRQAKWGNHFHYGGSKLWKHVSGLLLPIIPRPFGNSLLLASCPMLNSCNRVTNVFDIWSITNVFLSIVEKIDLDLCD